MNDTASHGPRHAGLARIILMALTALLVSACNLHTSTSAGGTLTLSRPASAPCTPTKGDTCGIYSSADSVTIEPVASSGHEFTGWEGDCTGMGICTVQMNRPHYIKANFIAVQQAVLHDTSSTLETLLEQGQLKGSCDRWQRDPAGASNYLEKACGKWMFFYGGFNIMGVPAAVAEFMTQNLPDTVGRGFSRFGMYADPYSSTGLPLGLAPGATVSGVRTLSFTCASCHFSRTEDGRYSAGLANHGYEYGKQIIALNYLPMATMPASMTASLLDPQTVAFLKPYKAELESRQLTTAFTMTLMKLAGLIFGGTPLPTVSPETQRQYLSWPAGTQDFVIAPVGAEDHVHTVSKIIPLWNLYTPEQMQAAGGPHAMLGWTGSTPDLDTFLAGFVALSQGTFPLEHLRPLKSYLLTLKAPPSALAQDSALVTQGASLFETKGCAGCHNGPDHAGTRIFSFDEIGTDAAMMRWADANLDGISDVPSVISDPLTHGIKAPRLVGLWAQKKFLHNGSVNSLEDLFCIDHDRPTRTDDALGDQGHRQTCDGLGDGDKQALIAFLRSL